MGITSFKELVLHKPTPLPVLWEVISLHFASQAVAGVTVNILRLGFLRYYILLISKLLVKGVFNVILSTALQNSCFCISRGKNNSLGGLIRRQETDCHLFSLCSRRKKVHSSCRRTVISTIPILTDEN